MWTKMLSLSHKASNIVDKMIGQNSTEQARKPMKMILVLLVVTLHILNCSSGGEATADATLSSSLTGYATTNTPQTTTVTSPESITLSSSVAQTNLQFQLNPAASGDSQGVMKTSLSAYNDEIAKSC